MTLLYIISTLLIIVAIVLLLNLTPEQITNDLIRIITPEQSLRDMAKIAQNRKKSRKITKEFTYIKDALIATGKEKQFTIVCASSLFLCIGGFVVAIFIGNIFLAPVMAVGMAMLPFIYVKSSLSYYERQIKEELETTISVISTSYDRTENIVLAISENLHDIKVPLKSTFKKFIIQATIISSDLKAALYNLKDSIDDEIFKEWCDCLIQCQDERTLKYTLMPIINKMTDVRIVNSQLKTMLSDSKTEYYTMVALVLGNVLLLFMLNKEWFMTLMTTVLGKIILAITFVVIFVTALFMVKYTKHIEYKR